MRVSRDGHRGRGHEVAVLKDGFSSAVRELTDGRGVDVCSTRSGIGMFGEALRALAPEGRILLVGFAAGGTPELRVNRLLLRNVFAVGVVLDVDAGLMLRAGDALNEMYEAGVVRPKSTAAMRSRRSGRPYTSSAAVRSAARQSSVWTIERTPGSSLVLSVMGDRFGEVHSDVMTAVWADAHLPTVELPPLPTSKGSRSTSCRHVVRPQDSRARTPILR
jgi:Zinc-binding dehydrogenase